MGSLSHFSSHCAPKLLTTLVHTALPFVVGSGAPYHHPIVDTSADSVDDGTEVGGDPRGWAK